MVWEKIFVTVPVGPGGVQMQDASRDNQPLPTAGAGG